jgi:hypothetical protein
VSFFISRSALPKRFSVYERLSACRSPVCGIRFGRSFSLFVVELVYSLGDPPYSPILFLKCYQSIQRGLGSAILIWSGWKSPRWRNKIDISHELMSHRGVPLNKAPLLNQRLGLSPSALNSTYPICFDLFPAFGVFSLP